MHSIPTKDILEERGFIGEVQCNDSRQSILHVLRDCPYAKCFWNKTQACMFMHDFYSLDLCLWMKKNLGTIPCHNSLIPWNIYFSFAIWNLWQDRNNILFKNLLSNSDLSRDVNCVAGEYLFCNSRFVISGGSRNFSQGVPEWACLVTFFSFLDFSSNFFFSFFFLLESNVMNTVLDPVSICLVKRNISVPIYFDVPFQGVSGFLKKIKNNIYLYFLIQHKIIDSNK